MMKQGLPMVEHNALSPTSPHSHFLITISYHYINAVGSGFDQSPKDHVCPFGEKYRKPMGMALQSGLLNAIHDPMVSTDTTP